METHTKNISPFTQKNIRIGGLPTSTVATLFGKAFVRIEDDAVIDAPKPMASITLTRKHMAINIGPSGSWSMTLKRNRALLQCQAFFFLIFTVLVENSSASPAVTVINLCRLYF